MRIQWTDRSLHYYTPTIKNKEKLQTSEPADNLLKGIQKGGSVAAIHLYVMKLEGNGEAGLEPVAVVFAPHEHGIAEEVGVLIDNAI